MLRFRAEAAFSEPPSAVKDLFTWRGAPHIAVYAANAVVAAHDSNYLQMKGLLRLARLAQNAAEHPVDNDELLLWAGEAVAGPTGPAARRLAPPRLGSPYAADATPPCRAGLPLLTVDPYACPSGHLTMVSTWGARSLGSVASSRRARLWPRPSELGSGCLRDGSGTLHIVYIIEE